MRKSIVALVAAMMMFGANQATADIIPFALQGNVGFGLLGGNENPAVLGGGSGGLGAGGINFDTDTNILMIDVDWGSGNGFIDLTGNATVMHIHGPTTSSGAASFSENAGVLITLHTLGGFNNSASSGGLNDSVSIAAGNVGDLLNGSLYINVHSTINAGGEIRGNLVAIPEPGSAIFIGAIAVGFGLIRRRR